MEGEEEGNGGKDREPRKKVEGSGEVKEDIVPRERGEEAIIVEIGRTGR